MNKKFNSDVREKAKKSGVRFWQIAEAIGVSEPTFTRLMREEMSEQKKAMIYKAIELIKNGKNPQIIACILKNEKDIQECENKLQGAKKQVEALEKQLNALKLYQHNLET